jgi:hypothetical protein
MSVVPVAVAVGCTPDTPVAQAPQVRAAQVVPVVDRSPEAGAVAVPVAARAESVEQAQPVTVVLAG